MATHKSAPCPRGLTTKLARRTGAYFIVRDANGQALACVYFEDRGPVAIARCLHFGISMIPAHPTESKMSPATHKVYCLMAITTKFDQSELDHLRRSRATPRFGAFPAPA